MNAVTADKKAAGGEGGAGVQRGIGEESAGKKAWARLGEGEKHGRDEQTDQLVSQLEATGVGGGGEGGGGGGAHVADVMVPSELQMCVPVAARAHACTVGWCVMARVAQELRESLWCGCGGTVLGHGLIWRLSATERGATSDVLAALYLPEGQAEQPVLQLESQLELQLESQLEPQ